MRFRLLVLISLWIGALAPSLAFAETSTEIVSPVIRGDTLHITGRIDSHVYNFLAYEAAALRNVRVLELDSYGGNITWALEIAKKLRTLKLTTKLASGNNCASACVVLFAAGARRLAAADAWFGIHGARGGDEFTRAFERSCFTGEKYDAALPGCATATNTWYESAKKMTGEYFGSMELSGVSRRLRDTYLAMPDDSDWVERLNILRKPDWVLPARDAMGFSLVTGVL